ncbi:MAG: GtrA family protein [Chloroflexota bacterium]
MGQTNTTASVYEQDHTRRIRSPWDLLNYTIEVVASRFGSKSKEVERFLKFAFVGVIGAIVDFGTLLVLQATILVPVQPDKNLKVILATSIAFFAAVLSNFIWNRFWTYPDSRSRSIRRQMAQFTFINAVGWSLRTLWIRFTFLPIGVAVMPLFVQVMTQISPEYTVSPETVGKVGTITSQFIALWFVMLWNFFANRYWTYNDVD